MFVIINEYKNLDVRKMFADTIFYFPFFLNRSILPLWLPLLTVITAMTAKTRHIIKY